MRRLFALIVILALLMGVAIAQTDDAAELAVAMAQHIPQMGNVQQDESGAIWLDSRLQQECSLIVHGSEFEAQCYMLKHCTKRYAVRAVGICTIAMESGLPMEEMEAYERALAESMGVEFKSPRYILNVNTGKFHECFCSSVEDMKDSNKLPYAGDRALVLDYGYVPCKRCCP